MDKRVLFLIVMAIAIVLPAMATPYCPTGSIISDTTVLPTFSSVNNASGCTLSSMLVLNGSSIPSLSATAGRVEMSFVRGTVSAGGFIQIVGPSAETAAIRVPLIVSVVNNTFGNGAAVLVTGSFPPDSNITLSFNKFTSSTPCARMTWRITNSFVTVVAIADVVPIVQHNRSEINVQYNAINTSSSTMSVHSIPLVVNAITFHTNASARVKGNTILSRGASPTSRNTWIILFNHFVNTWIILFNNFGGSTTTQYVVNETTYSIFWFFGSGARWEFEDNWMQATTKSNNLAYIGNTPLIPNATNGGVFSISRNFFRAGPDLSVSLNSCFGGGAGNVGTNFTFLFVGNTLEVYNVDNYMTAMGFDLSGSSSFVFADNNFTSANLGAGFTIVFYPLTLRDTSSLVVRNNVFMSKVGPTKLNAMNFTNLTLADDATLSLFNNAMDAPVPFRTYNKKLFHMSGAPNISSTSRVVVCGNRYFGPRLNRLTFNASSSGLFLSMPIQHCDGTGTHSGTHSQSPKTQAPTSTLSRSSATSSQSLSGTRDRPATATGVSPTLSVQSAACTGSGSASATSTSTESLSRSSRALATASVTSSQLARSPTGVSASTSLATNCTAASELCAQILVASGGLEFSNTCGSSILLPAASYFADKHDSQATTAAGGHVAVTLLLRLGPANPVAVEATSIANLSASVIGPRPALNGSLLAIDVACTPLVLTGSKEERPTNADVGVNISFAERCDGGRVGGAYWRVVAFPRPVVYLPKEVFGRDSVAEDAATAVGVVSVTVGAVALPIAAVQQGVGLALVRMAQCEESALNGQPLDLLIHPLRFAVGEGASAYGRGAVIGNLLVIPLFWSALNYLALPALLRLVARQPLAACRDIVGWPGIAVTPLAVLSEGSAMASMALLASASGSVVDILLGAIGSAVLLVALAGWLRALWLMKRLGEGRVLVCERQHHRGWRQVVHPRFDWLVASGGSDARDTPLLLDPPPQTKEVPTVMSAKEALFLAKRLALVGNSWWLWSSATAFALALVVGAAEGLPVSAAGQLCTIRWAVASVAAVGQAVVVMTGTVPAELFLLGFVGALTCVLAVLISLSTYGLVEHTDSTVAALNVVGTINSVVGMLLIATGTIATGAEVMRKRSKRRAAEMASCVVALGDTELAPLPPSLDVADEETEGSEPLPPPGIEPATHPAAAAGRWAAILLEAEEAAELAAAQARYRRDVGPHYSAALLD